jgi:hypothetical protein
MTYSNHLVACVKVNGQILRDSNFTVTIPYGSEYSILLKNLNTVRIQAKVFIDGQDATGDTWLVIGPNSSLELERFIRNGNMNAGNKFKFIPRTKQIEKHRGLKADDGLIRIEYKTEKESVRVPIVHYDHYYHYDYWGWPYYWPYYPNPYRWNNGTIFCNTNTTGNVGQAQTENNNVHLSDVSNADLGTVQVSYTASSLGSAESKSSPLRCAAMNFVKSAEPVDDSGITVPGSESHQQFVNASQFEVYENSEVLVIRLRGEVAGKRVAKAVTVKTKTRCETCGKVNKKGVSKFCSECGTALAVI